MGTEGARVWGSTSGILDVDIMWMRASEFAGRRVPILKRTLFTEADVEGLGHRVIIAKEETDPVFLRAGLLLGR